MKGDGPFPIQGQNGVGCVTLLLFIVTVLTSPGATALQRWVPPLHRLAGQTKNRSRELLHCFIDPIWVCTVIFIVFYYLHLFM